MIIYYVNCLHDQLQFIFPSDFYIRVKYLAYFGSSRQPLAVDVMDPLRKMKVALPFPSEIIKNELIKIELYINLSNLLEM